MEGSDYQGVADMRNGGNDGRMRPCIRSGSEAISQVSVPGAVYVRATRF
jgi:hypothetical protein